MIRRPPRSTRTDTLFPYTTLFRSLLNLRTAMTGGEISSTGPNSARVTLRLPNGAAYPIEGRLQFADVSVDASTGSVTLRATFPHSQNLLLPGMFVRAQIIEGTASKALMVPASGVSRDEAGRPVVLVLDGKIGRASCRERVCQYV